MGSGCVALLGKRLLPIPEVCSSNPVIGKNLFILNICLLSTVYWKDENKEKDGWEWPFLINIFKQSAKVNFKLRII